MSDGAPRDGARSDGGPADGPLGDTSTGKDAEVDGEPTDDGGAADADAAGDVTSQDVSPSDTGATDGTLGDVALGDGSVSDASSPEDSSPDGPIGDGSTGDAPSADGSPSDGSNSPPTLTISAPDAGAVLTARDDCSGAAGMQVRVTGSTDARDGSPVSISIGGGAPIAATVSAGTFSVCADAPAGSNIPIDVSVTETGRGTTTASALVTIDARPVAINDLTAVVIDNRRGTVRFSWTAVPGSDGATLSRYEMRCSEPPISGEPAWGAAQPMVMTSTPAAPGTGQAEVVAGFRTGQTRYCVLRGVGPASNLTPLPPASTSVTPVFVLQQVTFGGSTRLGNSIAAVGDINGDGKDDVVTGGAEEAYLYFGSALPLSATTRTRIVGSAGFSFRVAGIGDFNGDNRPDFALAASGWSPGGGAANRGAVFLFYGRPSSAPWPASISIAATLANCSGPDVCFVGDDGVAASGPDEVAALGLSISSAGDFNGDGLMDIAIGAPLSGGSTAPGGRLYVILGHATSYPSGSVVPVPGTTGPNGFFIEGDVTVRRQLGFFVASLGGDLDGDSRHDVLLQSAGGGTLNVVARADRLAGRAHAGTGLVNVSLTALDPLGAGSTGFFYGATLAAAGDVDGDSILDALVFDRTAGGTVEIHFGQQSGFASGVVVPILNDLANTTGDQFGSTLGIGRHPSLGNIGDLDEDGRADTLVGSVEEGTVGGGGDLFYAIATRTSRSRRTRDMRFGPVASSFAATDGIRAAYIGDVNGDGFPDVAIGDPAYSSNTGRMTIWY